MLDIARLTAQLDGFAAYHRDERKRHAERLRHAREALSDCAPQWRALAEVAEKERGGPLRAIPLSDPSGCIACGPRPDQVTVVATDGSQVYPDRHVEPACYLLNVGRVAFQYGALEAPLIRAEPSIHYRQEDLAHLFPNQRDAPVDISSDVVSALRDQEEIQWLLDTATEVRRSGREILALADGTLIRWMLSGLKNADLEERLLGAYLETLTGFQEAGIPLCSYISRPANAEVINLMELHRAGPGGEAAAPTLRGLQDHHLMTETLAVGERSALFASRSQVLKQYGPHEVVAFYVRLPEEVGRVEMPRWVAESGEGWLDLIHAVIFDQAEKGGGYPIALQEAHQRAVIRAEEKEIFYRTLARHLRTNGIAVPTYSGKAASKRMPRL